ncbi:MAG: DNA polymerase III subunit delta, partial [Planctomycetia bacterium]
VAALRQRLFPEGDPGGSCTRLNARDSQQREQAFGAAEELRAGSLFGGGRLVVVDHPEALGAPGAGADDPDDDGHEPDEGAGQGGEATAPARKLRSPMVALAEPALEARIAGSLLVLATARPVKGQGAIPLATLVKKGALVVDCRPLYDAPGPWDRGAAEHEHELGRHLVRRARQAHGKALALQEAHALTRRVGSELGELEQALETLARHAGARASLSADDLEACFAGTREEAAWGLVEAVLDGRRAEALAQLESALAQGVTDGRGGTIAQPEALCPMLCSVLHAGWRRALAGAEALSRGEPEGEVARSAGLPAFRAEPWLRRCRRMAPRAWQQLNTHFLEAEEGFKSGQVPAATALTRLVVALVAPVPQRP